MDRGGSMVSTAVPIAVLKDFTSPSRSRAGTITVADDMPSAPPNVPAASPTRSRRAGRFILLIHEMVYGPLSSFSWWMYT